MISCTFPISVQRVRIRVRVRRLQPYLVRQWHAVGGAAITSSATMIVQGFLLSYQTELPFRATVRTTVRSTVAAAIRATTQGYHQRRCLVSSYNRWLICNRWALGQK